MGEGERFVLVDGYQRWAALTRLGRDTTRDPLKELDRPGLSPPSTRTGLRGRAAICDHCMTQPAAQFSASSRPSPQHRTASAYELTLLRPSPNSRPVPGRPPGHPRPVPDPERSDWGSAPGLSGQRRQRPEAPRGHRGRGRVLPAPACQHPSRRLSAVPGGDPPLRGGAGVRRPLHRRGGAGRVPVHPRDHGIDQPGRRLLGTGQPQARGRDHPLRAGTPLQYRALADGGRSHRGTDPGHSHR